MEGARGEGGHTVHIQPQHQPQPKHPTFLPTFYKHPNISQSHIPHKTNNAAGIHGITASLGRGRGAEETVPFPSPSIRDRYENCSKPQQLGNAGKCGPTTWTSNNCWLELWIPSLLPTHCTITTVLSVAISVHGTHLFWQHNTTHPPTHPSHHHHHQQLQSPMVM